MKTKTKKLPKEQCIGVTEAGEIAFNLKSFRHLYNGNIIITKRLTDELINLLVKHKDKIILHLCVTGFGSTKIEPFVPSIEETYKKFSKLIEEGFPLKQVVLRIDPIVPSERGGETATKVLERFGNMGIERVRISFLDNYAHVKKRFEELGIDPLYNGKFHSPLYLRIKWLEKITDTAHQNGFSSIEVCGEPGIESVPCLSQKDIDILGLSDIVLEGSSEQRGSCGCPKNKRELIRVKPERCPNSCLYCYWKDGKKSDV